ncbi:MAG: hypothetical protein HN712_15875 [Gemmatimonadetes bacterium]|nr:hypothetical protein [Gemmatimonadota bacterium]
MSEMTARSDKIVIGRVGELALTTTESVRLADDLRATLVFTYMNIEVLETLKGEGGSSVTVKLLGGRVGESMTVVPDAAMLIPDEEVMVFLQSVDGTASDGQYQVLSGDQGVFSIREDGTLSRRSAHPNSALAPGFDESSIPVLELRQEINAEIERLETSN